ncbi:uncharacterized protein KY384_006246 [Bacidia gigantensis]|uniref:uncharacterized protein n=1 Tax=Bacidia gigantensis TaxID=2732470 RepID=UPI001D05B088|nr:uncharacterized protein KY384_006246 [Bacidia gigantensis]KAG8529609.1 hypothetical protein KY384_006246 [Bacidia gigantensis]
MARSRGSVDNTTTYLSVNHRELKMSNGNHSPTILTPATSVAPSTTGVSDKPKLPLAVRKNVRDNWEAKRSELEARLSSVLGTPWTAAIDPAELFSFATGNQYASQNMGEMIAEYISTATDRVTEFSEKYGSDGISDLNNVAGQHTIGIAHTSRSDVNYSGCEISNGCLLLLFKDDGLGVNIYSAADDLAIAVDNAEVVGNGGDVTKLGFLARSSIKADYDLKIDEVKADIQKTLDLSVLELSPGFEENYAKLATYDAAKNYDFPRDFKEVFGDYVFQYFEGFAEALKDSGFAGDDMMQEGFKEAVEKNEIGLRVVDKLEKGDYNECVIENGVVYMQTTAENWTVNIRDPARRLIDLL